MLDDPNEPRGITAMNPKKILIVDDEPAILGTLQQIFERSGYEALTAETAEKALSILENETVMIMFLDLKLPGMSGVELCRRIRQKNRIAIIHALTGYVNIFGQIECREAGFDDFFVKPVDINVLLKAAEGAVEKLHRWKVDEYEVI